MCKRLSIVCPVEDSHCYFLPHFRRRFVEYHSLFCKRNMNMLIQWVWVVWKLLLSMGDFLLSAGTKGKRYSLPNSRIMIQLYLMYYFCIFEILIMCICFS